MSNVHPFPAAPDEDDGEYVDRRVPADTAAEQAVLSACMYDAANFAPAAALLDRSDFYKPAHQLVWDVLQRQVANNEPTNFIALHAEIEKLGQLRLVNGGDYLLAITQAPSVSAEYFAGIVQEKAVLRRKAELGVRIATEVGRGADPEHLDKLIREHLEDEEHRAKGGRTSSVDALLAEMLDTTALDNMPALEPLVGDLLHLDTLARIIGPSGHMKSFVTIDFAGHVGTGKPWHGQPVRQGTVVYLVAEGARGIRKRVRAWEQHHGLRMENVLFLPRPVQAMDPEWLTLIQACTRLAPAFIIIDTQARVSVGVEENSAKEMGLVIDRMEQLRAATGACTLVIHHTGHVGDHGRGSSSAKGALQSELHVSKRGDRASNTIVTIKTGKQKDDEQGADLEFGLRVVDIAGEYKANGSPLTSVVLQPLWDQPKRLETGSPEWLVAVLDKAAIPLAWGSPKVIKWCADAGIQMRKSKIEEAVRFRKTRDSFDDPRNGTNQVPPNLPRDLEGTPPRDQGGTSGESEQNPRSNIPPNPGGGPGEATSTPPSPRSLPREGGGEKATPICTLCGEPFNADWAARGYTTHVMCDTTPDEP